MVIFERQNAPNCTIKKKFFGGHAPEPPYHNAWLCYAPDGIHKYSYG